MIGSATACVERFLANFFVARLESVLLTTVSDALVLYRNRDVPVPFSVLGLWELYGSSICTSESQASVVRRTGAVGTWCCIATGTGSVATLRSSARLNRAHLPFMTTRTSTTSSMNDSGSPRSASGTFAHGAVTDGRTDGRERRTAHNG